MTLNLASTTLFLHLRFIKKKKQPVCQSSFQSTIVHTFCNILCYLRKHFGLEARLLDWADGSADDLSLDPHGAQAFIE